MLQLCVLLCWLLVYSVRKAEWHEWRAKVALSLQVYHQVHALLPDVHYSALARVLSLKTPGKRKQERLPGKPSSKGCCGLQGIDTPSCQLSDN